MLQDITFEDPAPLVRNGGRRTTANKIAEFARTLANGAPNRWALYDVLKENGSSSQLYAARKELANAEHPIVMDIASRKQPDGSIKVYVRASHPSVV